MEPLCFSLMRHTLRSVTQDVLSSPVSLDPAEKGCAKEVISTKSPLQVQTPPGGGGGGAFGPVYITVAVGNRIHQIKSSIYLCGSGDSGGGAGG